jgi:DNA-binding SARP family transcriptional activator
MRKFFIILFLLNIVIARTQEFDYGLYFNAYKSQGGDRTSLVLNNNESLKFKDEITLSFDLSIRKEIVFGNIVRLVSDTNESITLNFGVDEMDIRYPNLLINENRYTIMDTIEFDNWLNVTIKLSKQKDSLFLSYEDVEQSYSFNFRKWENIKISFGVCPFPGFQTSECAPVNIRDIRIYEKGTLTRHWDLKQHNENVCYDLIKNIPAIVRNPIWLIDNHTNWTEIYTKHITDSNNPQYAYNTKEDLLYIIPDEKLIIVYNPVTKRDSTIYVKKGYPAGISTNELIYDYLNNELVSYSLDEQTVSRFSFETQIWDKQTSGNTETRFWHHTASINPSDSSLIAFGGYGYYKYKNNLFKLDLRNGAWTQTNLTAIPPRYSPASAIVNNKLYIFGGRGSESGQQEVNPHNYYDLYSVNLETNEIEVVWETNSDFEFLPCGNMIYNQQDSNFYVLTNKYEGTLFRISISKPEMQELSVRIKQSLKADFTFYTLFYSSNLQKIFAIFVKNYKKGDSDITFYEISYPPLSLSEALQQPSFKKKLPANTPVFILVISCIIILSSIIMLQRKRKNKTLLNRSTHYFTDNKHDIKRTKSDTLEGKTSPLAYLKSGSFEKKIFDRTKCCISLLGGFNIMNKDGIDITEKFTPKLKSLFLLLLLYSSKEEHRGLTDKEIEEFLWIDKDEDSARNNRSVYLRKLQILLDEIGDVKIEKKNRFRRILIKNGTSCDYIEAYQYITEAMNNDNNSEIFYKGLIELLSYGPLLPKTIAEWLDKFKGDYSGMVIDFIEKVIFHEVLPINDSLKLYLADIIFAHDTLNENALNIKCSILYGEGRKGMAKNIYDNFCRDYQKSMGETFRIPFSKLTDKK